MNRFVESKCKTCGGIYPLGLDNGDAELVDGKVVTRWDDCEDCEHDKIIAARAAEAPRSDNAF